MFANFAIVILCNERERMMKGETVYYIIYTSSRLLGYVQANHCNSMKGKVLSCGIREKSYSSSTYSFGKKPTWSPIFPFHQPLASPSLLRTTTLQPRRKLN